MKPPPPRRGLFLLVLQRSASKVGSSRLRQAPPRNPDASRSPIIAGRASVPNKPTDGH